MAKRRLTNRLSKQLSLNKSFGSSFGSGYLDPDTNILGEDNTFWWKNLGEDAILPHSSTYNQGNETSVQLSFNSNVNSIYDKSNWWKHLESDEQNISISKHNYSAGLIKTHVMEISTSESEKEPDVKRRKLPLRAANRKSDSNAFLNALSENTSTVLLKQKNNRISNKISDKKVSRKKSHENDSLSSSLETEDIVKLRPNIFKTKRKDEEITNKNIFQDMLNQDISDHNTGKQSTELVKESKSHLMNKNINTNNDLTNEQEKANLIEALQLQRKSIDSSNVSTQNTQNIETNKTQNTDESDLEMHNESSKHKPRFMRRTRQSVTSNAFKDVLSDNTDINVSEEIPSQDIDILNAKVLSTRSLNNSSKRSVSGSIYNTEIKKNTSFNKSSRHTNSPKDTLSQNIDTYNIKCSSVAKSHSLVTSLNRFAGGSKADIDKNMSIRGNARSTSSINNNSNRSIDTSDAKSVTKSESLVTSLKRHVNRSKNKIDIDKNISLSRSSRRITTSKDDSNQDIELSDAESLSETRSPVGSPKKLADSSKSKVDIDKNTLSRSSRRITTSKDDLNQDIELSDAESLSVTRSRSPVSSPKRLASSSKSKIDIDKNTPFSRSSRCITISKDNSNQDIELSDAESLSETRSPVDSPKKLADSSKSKINIDKNTLSRSSRRITTSKDNPNQDIELFDAESPSVTRSRSPVGSPKRLASSSKKKIDKNTSFNRSPRNSNIPEDNPIKDIIYDTKSEQRSQSPVSFLKKLASRSESKIDVDKNISRSKYVMDPSSSKDNPSQNILDTSDATFSSAKRSSKLGQRSKSKIGVNKNISHARSPRLSSSSKNINKQLLDTSEEESQNNYILQIERSSRNSTEVNIPEKILKNAATLETEKDNHEDVLTTQKENRMNKSKTVPRSSSIASYLNEDGLQEKEETSRREKNLKESDIQNHNVPIKRQSLNKNITAFNISKIVKTPKTIDTFFKQSSSMADKQLSSNKQMLSQDFNEKMERIKVRLEGMKNREITVMKRTATNNKKESASRNSKPKGIALKRDTKKIPIKIEKPVNKAFLVNGKVYRAPRLPRPKHWATDNLYRFLWKRMEPKYNLTTRIKSEKFVQELAKVVSFIERRKKYENYKNELEALMKEMARLSIIHSRNDFYDFCLQFLPYEFRVKVVPMLLPGNKKNIPYNPEMLHTPLLNNE